MCGTAAAASSRSTVMRTNSDPAREQRRHCAMVPSTSAVSVLVMDCTTIGAPPADGDIADHDFAWFTPRLGPAFSGTFSGLFMRSRISGFGDIHQGAVRRAEAHLPGEPRPRTGTSFFSCTFNVLGLRFRHLSRHL